MLRIPALELASNRMVIAVAGTPEIIPTTGQIREVMICALPKNLGIISVGGPNVSADLDTLIGMPLYSSDVFIVDVDKLDLIYIDAEVSGEGFTYLFIW